MVGLTKQERRIIQLLLVLFVVGMAVTVYKRERFGNSWIENIDLEKTRKEFTRRTQFDTTEENIKSDIDSLGIKLFENSDSNTIPLSQFTGKININTSTAGELELLPGIGPALAQKIIDFRQENERFNNIEQIKQIKGIGEKKYEQIHNLISVE